MSDHIPDLDDEEAIRFGEMDMAMEEAIRNMDDYLPDLTPEDRTLVILHMRWAFMDGFAAAAMGALTELTNRP